MKKKDEKYDIFISYRRDNGWDTAKHLRDILTAKGYSVFFDVDSLRSGDFNRALLDVIKNCTDFIIILSPNALDRCVNEGDWVRQELACALETGKNVIPVISGKFHFPEKLPDDINAVRWKNAITVNIEFFDAMVEKLISFLHSKPHKHSFLRWLIPAAVICLAAAVMILQPWKKQSAEPAPVPEVQATPAQVETTQTENAQPEVSRYENNVLMSDIFPSTDWYNAEKWTVLGSEITRGEIGSVTFLDTLDNATKDAWDVSQYGDGSVKAWTEKNGELYDLYIAGKGGVCAPTDCSVLFSGYRNAKSINFGSAFHTEKTVDMRYMFSICENLRGLNLSTFRTENVTDMNSMFQYCSNLQVLDISSFNTSSVKNMGRMFMECRALAMLDVSGFDTSRVTDMAEMFFRCSSLRELDLSSFIMNKVSDISGMFFKCASITDLKLSRFETAMNQELKRDSLFEGCTMLSDVYFDGTEAEWSAAGLGETLPEGVTVHFAQAEVIQPESEEIKHIWGDYAPEGTAAILTKDGAEYTAIANSLVRKARGIEPSRSAANLYSGYDNPSEDSEYLAKDMVYFKDMASLIRTDDVFTVTDQSGNSKEVKLLTDASLLFIGTQDNGIALEIKEKDIVSIHFDWSAVPDTNVRYCKITQTDGSFTAPTALFWLLVNKNEGTGNPPSMMLSRELTPYSDRQISIQDLERIEITKNPTDAEFGNSAEDYQTKMTVYFKNGDQIDITTSKFIVFYAKAKDGLMHTLNNSRLSEIVFY